MLVAPAAAQQWIEMPSGTTASLRGLSAAGSGVVWASGTGGTYVVSADGGKTWKAAVVPGAAGLDFRDVHAVDGRTAYLLSSGPGDKSRIYKTSDAGATWSLLFTNPDAKGFLDAIAFWDPRNGIAMGDPVDGHPVILTTADGGASWVRQSTPAALENEGAFAASGTCLVVRGGSEAWFATGGTGAARVFHSTDRGRTWTVAATPIRNDGPSAGIFSLAFSGGRNGVAVGGDYAKPESAAENVAVSSDGGRTWKLPSGAPPAGFRSVVVWLPVRKAWIAAGTSGSDVSTDNGVTWRRFDSGNYNAAAFDSTGAGWAVGPRGRLARFEWR